MDEFTVAGASLNQTPLDWEGNRQNILRAITAARKAGAQALCLPELCISGYGCEDAFHGESVAQSAWESLQKIIPHTQQLIVALGLPVSYKDELFNTVALVVDGKLVGINAKRLLAGYGVHYEPRWFKAWSLGCCETLHTLLGDVPIGDLSYQIGKLRLGFEICEEAWGGSERQLGAGDRPDVLFNPSASHFAFGKYETVRTIVLEASRQAHALYVYCNLLGNEAGRIVYDGAVLAASNGQMLAELPRFSYQSVRLCVISTSLRSNQLEWRRINYPRIHNTRPHNLVVWQERASAKAASPTTDMSSSRQNPISNELYGTALPEVSTTIFNSDDVPPATASLQQEEEFLRAVSLGIWDYLRKSRSQGCALSLSGGVDSASVAVLCAAMVQLSLQELGAIGVKAALSHVKDIENILPAAPDHHSLVADENTVRALTHRLLLTAYQASANSSETTRKAAREVALAIGANHLELDIQPLVSAYESLMEKALGHKLNWEEDDLALQNIQARARSPSIWLAANMQDFLLLGSTNRSEMGVGYMTMDGDTSSGFAPIAGANKTFIHRWMKWMETQGSPFFGPLPVLAAVNRQAPTAELRPLEQSQQDERDLMPYVLLDAIEQAAIRDRMSPLQTWRHLLNHSPLKTPLDPIELAQKVSTFFQLWGRSQWKRERMAPSLHLDDENLDPRTWCRFPILTSGWREELDQLMTEAAKVSSNPT